MPGMASERGGRGNAPDALTDGISLCPNLQALESKAGALSGALGDATPFNGRTVEDIAAELEALGAQRHGDEVMYNPRTGEQVPCAIFLCPTYYQRLKHMVEDKVSFSLPLISPSAPFGGCAGELRESKSLTKMPCDRGRPAVIPRDPRQPTHTLIPAGP